VKVCNTIYKAQPPKPGKEQGYTKGLILKNREFPALLGQSDMGLNRYDKTIDIINCFCLQLL